MRSISPKTGVRAPSGARTPVFGSFLSFRDLLNLGIWGGQVEANARGGQACLAQARQNRPGKGELDLTELC